MQQIFKAFPLVPRGRKDYKGRKAFRVSWVRRDRKGFKAIPVRKVFKATSDLRGQRGRLAHRDRGLRFSIAIKRRLRAW